MPVFAPILRAVQDVFQCHDYGHLGIPPVTQYLTEQTVH